MAQPTQLTPTEQDALVKQIGLAMLRVAPEDWEQLNVDYRAVGRYAEATGQVVYADQATEPWKLPPDLQGLFARLRGGMYREGRGTWYNARYRLDHPSSYNLEYDREEPVWDLPPPPQAYPDDVRLYPRSDDNMPEWLRRRLAVSPGPVAPPVAPPTPRFRVARIFDGPGEDGRPSVNRPLVDEIDLPELLAYLDGAPLVGPARGYDVDRLDPEGRQSVPVAFHTDGIWIWPAAVNYYLREHDIAPEPELVEHIRRMRFRLPQVDEQTRSAAQLFLGPPPAAPAPPRPAPTRAMPVPPRPSAPPPAAALPSQGPPGRSVDQLRGRLAELGVPESAYRIGAPAGRAWTMEQTDEGWRVGFYDREFVAPAMFEDVADASAFLLGKLLLDGETARPAEPVGDRTTRTINTDRGAPFAADRPAEHSVARAGRGFDRGPGMDHGGDHAIDPGLDNNATRGPSRGFDRAADSGLDHDLALGANHDHTTRGIDRRPGMDRAADPVRGTDHGIDRGPTMDRAADHTFDPSLDLARGMDRGPDHAMDRAPDPGPDHSLSRGPDHGANRGMDRGADHAIDPSLDLARGNDHGIDRGTDRTVDPSLDLARGANHDHTTRGMDRRPDHAMDRAADPGLDHSPGRGTDHNANHGMDRGAARAMDPGLDHSLGRGADHGANRGMDRGPDHAIDPSLDLARGIDHSANRGMDRRPDRAMDRAADLGVDRGIDPDADLEFEPMSAPIESFEPPAPLPAPLPPPPPPAPPTRTMAVDPPGPAHREPARREQATMLQQRSAAAAPPGSDWPIAPLPGEPPLTLFRGKRLTELEPGTEVDRYGDDDGNLVYAVGTPFAERSLVPEWVERPYHAYRVRQPVQVLSGAAIPWFDQPGGGTAYLLPDAVGELVAHGQLVEIPDRDRPVS